MNRFIRLFTIVVCLAERSCLPDVDRLAGVKPKELMPILSFEFLGFLKFVLDRQYISRPDDPSIFFPRYPGGKEFNHPDRLLVEFF